MMAPTPAERGARNRNNDFRLVRLFQLRTTERTTLFPRELTAGNCNVREVILLFRKDLVFQ